MDAENGVFLPDLLVSPIANVVTSCQICSPDGRVKIYRIDAAKNIVHGIMKDCDQTDWYHVSYLVFANCHQASKMKDELLELGKKARNIVRPYGLVHVETTKFVIDPIPDETFDAWLQKPIDPSDKKNFLELFCTIGAIHQMPRYFGNLRKGIRVRNNKLIFVLPAEYLVVKHNEGIWKDLHDLRRMVAEAMPHEPDQSLFDSLCEDFVGDIYHDGQLVLRHTGKSLRDASFFITHAPIVWSPEDRYHFIRKLCDYRSIDYVNYDKVVRDYSIPTIPDFPWQDKPKKAPNSPLGKLYNFKGHAASYENSESIRFFLRCAYEHPPLLNNDCVPYVEVDPIIYRAFPTAWWNLYKFVVINKLYQIGDRMGCPIVDYLQMEPHSLNF